MAKLLIRTIMVPEANRADVFAFMGHVNGHHDGAGVLLCDAVMCGPDWRVRVYRHNQSRYMQRVGLGAIETWVCSQEPLYHLVDFEAAVRELLDG